jgi:hypothetical protein
MLSSDGETGEAGNLPKRNTFSEIRELWVEKYFHIGCKGPKNVSGNK